MKKIKDVIKYYLNSSSYCKLKGSTQTDYYKHLECVLTTKVGNKYLGNVAIKDLNVRICQDAYNNWLLTGTRTANYRKAAFSVAWRHAMRFDLMNYNPITLVETVSSDVRRIRWKPDQVKTFLDVAYSDFKYRSIGLIVHMAYEWAQRVGDMRLLKWEQVDIPNREINFVQSKRNAEVHLPIGSSLATMLMQQNDHYGLLTEYVVPRTTPVTAVLKPYKKTDISPLVNEILDKAGLPPYLTAMDLRRTAITEMLEGGADASSIMQVSAHKNVASMKPYQVNTLKGAANALSKRDK
jgi:integrase|tara:strand:+ start:160 stop:1044 length:885 start_codon:yes stop_codon:yes gene_type:complete